MKKHIYSRILLFAAFFASISMQAQDSLQLEGVVIEGRLRKNTIRFNLTNPIIFGDRALILGYERTIGEHQSFSLNAGLAAFPNFNILGSEVDSVIQLHRDSKEKGYLITGDYRFYLASENKFRAPRGLYIGPFLSHTFMGRENTWDLKTANFTGTVNSDLKLYMTSIGAQLGYQFVFWKRVALDFVLIGPSVAFYSLSAKLDTDLSPEDESLLFEKISEALSERFPGYTFALDDVDFKTSGTTNTKGIGFRYTVHLGYRF